MVEIPKEQVDMLDALQAIENDGRGIVHVRTIVILLYRGQVDLAQNVYQTEGDKTRAYPKVQSHLREMFGCRLHLTKDCEDELCNQG